MGFTWQTKRNNKQKEINEKQCDLKSSTIKNKDLTSRRKDLLKQQTLEFKYDKYCLTNKRCRL
jgi:hypothetical protein